MKKIASRHRHDIFHKGRQSIKKTGNGKNVMRAVILVMMNDHET